MLVGLPNPPSRFADLHNGNQGSGTASAGAAFLPITADDQPCVGVYLQSPATNTDGVLVGNATHGARALEPGQTRIIRIDNANKVYLKRGGAVDQTVNWAVLRE